MLLQPIRDEFTHTSVCSEVIDPAIALRVDLVQDAIQVVFVCEKLYEALLEDKAACRSPAVNVVCR